MISNIEWNIKYKLKKFNWIIWYNEHFDIIIVLCNIFISENVDFVFFNRYVVMKQTQKNVFVILFN